MSSVKGEQQFWWVVDVSDYPDNNVLKKCFTESEAIKSKKNLSGPSNELDTLVVVQAKNMYEAMEKAPQYSDLGVNWFALNTMHFFDLSDVLKIPSTVLYSESYRQ